MQHKQRGQGSLKDRVQTPARWCRSACHTRPLQRPTLMRTRPTDHSLQPPPPAPTLHPSDARAAKCTAPTAWPLHLQPNQQDMHVVAGWGGGGGGQGPPTSTAAAAATAVAAPRVNVCHGRLCRPPTCCLPCFFTEPARGLDSRHNRLGRILGVVCLLPPLEPPRYPPGRTSLGMTHLLPACLALELCMAFFLLRQAAEHHAPSGGRCGIHLHPHLIAHWRV